MSEEAERMYEVPGSVLRQYRAQSERVLALEAWIQESLDLVGDGPCRPDHNGFCQEHCSGPPCRIARGRALLDPVQSQGDAPS